MPLLANLLASLFGATAASIAQQVATRVPIKLAAIAVFTASLAALMLVFNGYIAPLAAQAFSTQYGQFLGLAFPPIAGTCLSTLFSAFLAIQAYKLQQRIVAISSAA